MPCIAMRYVAGSDLGRRIAREGRLEPATAVALIAQVANGLDAIHAAGLVHRDVKPANVLLSGEAGNEHAYITDFGVARNVATNSGLTQTGRFVGTLDYVAPEQISGGQVDARVDVYALGCLLFKLLTGEVPFPREGEAARLYAHLNDPPPAPSLYAPAVGVGLDEIVARAMSKQPGDRYPSAGDLGRAASAALSGAPVAIPERTVATGAAATVEPETVQPAEPTAATGRLRREPPAPPRQPEADGSKRRPLLIGGGLATIAAIVVLAVVLISSGGGGGGEDTARGGAMTEASVGGAEKEAAEKEPKPKGLSTPALIRKADESCEIAKASYIEVGARRNAELESEAGMDVAYAGTLVGISGQQVSELRALKPSPTDAQAFREYLALRKAVARLDREALAAAKDDDRAAYAAAYQARNELTPELERVADEIGFEVCSQKA